MVMVVGGGLACAAARDPRLGAMGVAVVIAGSAFLAQPLPDPAALAIRLVAAAIVGELLWVAARGAPRARGVDPGWMVRAWLAAGAVAAGIGTAASWPGVAEASGPALAGAYGLLVVALPSFARLRWSEWRGAELLLPLVTAVLLWQAIGPPLSGMEQVMVAALVIAAGATVAGATSGAAGRDR
jgi:hypothetical protein